MKLILVRHGETYENTLRIIQGHLKNPLSDNGLKQARLLAARLEDECIDSIYSSDLPRAVMTTKEIAKKHPNACISYFKELRERNWGSLAGKKSTEINWDEVPGDAESTEEVEQRITNFLNKITKSEGNILIVSHGQIIRGLISLLLNKSFEEVENIKNTSVSIIEINEKGSIPKIINSTHHLGKNL